MIPDFSHLEIRRSFDYDRNLLPNKYLAELEKQCTDLQSALPHTGLSIGYPAWNLLYYTVLCALPPETEEVYVVETGTNAGWSTVILAQALRDRKFTSKVQTVDISRDMVEIAAVNLYRAGLAEQVQFNVGDSLAFLEQHMTQVPHLDFAFLDGSHEADHVVKEFEIIRPKLTQRYSTVYFDNTKEGGVAEAMATIQQRFGGNLVELPNCSWGPPGQAIWQPVRTQTAPAAPPAAP